MRPARPLACVLLAGLVLASAAAVPAAGAPPPRPVSTFDGGLGDEAFGPDYPPTNVSNVTVDVAVAANGTARWTERATLSNPDTVEAFRANATLRRAAVEDAFGYRFDRHVDSLRSELVGDALVVTYRLDGGVERGLGGGVVFAPFADYGNDHYPGVADVTLRPPEGYTVVESPEAFVRSGDALRWNSTTGPGDAGVSPGIVTFAPADATLPGLAAWLALVAAFGAATLRLALLNALALGLPVGVLLSGAVAAAGRRSWQAPAFVLPAGVGFAFVVVAAFPATSPMPPFWPYGLPLVVAGTLPMVLGGVALHALARR